MAKFTITCYGKTTEYDESERLTQIKRFLEAMDWSDGSEKARYANILSDLMHDCKSCKDE